MHGWEIQKLSSECASVKDLKKLILQEAIAARQSGQAELSNLLIEKSLELGFSSPRLKDNQARALINLKRFPEAVAIWRELLNSNEASGFEQQIHKMLDEYGLMSDRTSIVAKCSEYAANGDTNSAKEMAINAIIDDPEWEEPMNLLKDILKIELGEVTSQSSLDRDLKDHQLDLQAYEILVNYMEKRVGKSAIG